MRGRFVLFGTVTFLFTWLVASLFTRSSTLSFPFLLSLPFFTFTFPFSISSFRFAFSYLVVWISRPVNSYFLFFSLVNWLRLLSPVLFIILSKNPSIKSVKKYNNNWHTNFVFLLFTSWRVLLKMCEFFNFFFEKINPFIWLGYLRGIFFHLTGNFLHLTVNFFHCK